MSDIYCLSSMAKGKKHPFDLCNGDSFKNSHFVKRGKSELGTRITLKKYNISAGQGMNRLGNIQEKFDSELGSKVESHFFNFSGKECNNSTPIKYFSAQSLPITQQDKSKNNKKFIKDLTKLLEKTETSPLKFDMCKQALNHIGQKDAKLGKLLKIIGSEYENYIQSLSQMLEKTTEMLKQMEFEVKKSENEINKIKAQNSDLNIKLQKIHSKYNTLVIKFEEFGEKIIDKKEGNLEKLYEQTIQILEKESLYYKEKAVKMMKLLLNLEKKGYPIDSIYKNEVSQKLKFNSGKCNVFEEISFEAGSKDKFVPLEKIQNFNTSSLSQKNSEIFSTKEN
ncbi:hypothetical protein SteCoe_16902 [Stentor coeruleus]|uniref:Translin-associated factor X-interacting protein 1 N-terminal domain-containing protein n=1 Tax=Stentor coeruleus TaxID=5963 RepID=A0A1R2C087_9CILI|nr:hypothetical protein SteCoe_16902 [Stentor coeruleus]